jgi:hypothetical protein
MDMQAWVCVKMKLIKKCSAFRIIQRKDPEAKAMESKVDIRPSPIAGQWYQANAIRLAAQIDRFLEEAELPEIEGDSQDQLHTPGILFRRSSGLCFAAVRPIANLVAVVSRCTTHISSQF